MSEFDLQECNNRNENGNDNGNDIAAEVPFCCVQVVPGNLEVIEDRLEAEDLKMTFTPKLECCIKEEDLSCMADNVSCSIDGEVLRLVGCIEYAISTINGTPDPIRGDFSTEAPQQNSADVSCKSTVCVNEIICCGQDLECPDDLDLDEIIVDFEDAKVKECPKWADEPDKKIIKFTGRFILPEAIVDGCPPDNGNGNGDICECRIEGSFNFPSPGGGVQLVFNPAVCGPPSPNQPCDPEESNFQYRDRINDVDVDLDAQNQGEMIESVRCDNQTQAVISGTAQVVVGGSAPVLFDFTLTVTDALPTEDETVRMEIPEIGYDETFTASQGEIRIEPCPEV